MPSAVSAATYVYNVSTEIGAVNTLISDDGWAGADLPNWIVANGASVNGYMRNNNGGDDTVYRTNDAAWSFSIPGDTTFLSIEIVGRAGSGFWQAGIANYDGSSLISSIGMGGDFNVSDKYFILNNGARTSEVGTSATGDALHTLRIDVSGVSGAMVASLFYDNTQVVGNTSLGSLTWDNLSQFDSLYLRTGSQFVGPSQFSITAIPEPTAALLGAFGAFGLLLRRRA